jgi:hypothetical protein
MNVLAATWHCSEQGHANIPTVQRQGAGLGPHGSAIRAPSDVAWSVDFPSQRFGPMRKILEDPALSS